MSEPISLSAAKTVRSMDEALKAVREGKIHVEILAASLDVLDENQLRHAAEMLAQAASTAYQTTEIALESFKGVLERGRAQQ